MQWLHQIQTLPSQVESAIINLDEAQLHTPYRDGGWTLHEVVHHIADSHINAYTRFKLALTENVPTIKSYIESEWAKLADVKSLPVNISITLLLCFYMRAGMQLLKTLRQVIGKEAYIIPNSKKK